MRLHPASAHMGFMKTSKAGPRGRKDYHRTVIYPDCYVKVFLPTPMSYTMHAEGDVTFSRTTLGNERTPRKIKKWMRREMDWGRWQPWWTNHATRVSAPLPAGVLR